MELFPVPAYPFNKNSSFFSGEITKSTSLLISKA